MKVVFTTTQPTITEPRAGDAGYDLHAAERAVIRPGTRERISVGAHIELPPCTVGLIRDRSGLAHFHGLTVLGGVIDQGYRGLVSVVLLNTDERQSYEVNVGDRVAQLVILPILTPALEIVEGTWEMTTTARAENGFMSSGR